MKIAFINYRHGAELATDLVNTSAMVRRATGEALPGPAALTRFLAEHEVRPDALAGGRQPAEEELAGVHALRTELRAVLEARTEHDVVDAATTLVMRAGAGVGLAPDEEGRWQWYLATAPKATLAGELAALAGAGLLGALRTLGHDRFRRCASPECEGMFVDTSRAGRRRYCMPELCGNRLNVANHRARKLGAQSP
ncbi:CGNR zinc finger domain-containing protein [Amycolatopsis cihanbeyliensis]|uniref:Putative RNA-binding Zn ribbon-like protein n=1 Tax=Amycolatopsis cihanbeyliensis TaxID=1128664 RepID=A0A542DIL1_AMYCI|nr:CGNR zinc finger domain-containing protein [Amycolatopsis cihanbeyliensis]TQJ02942.1 putative RNA-binding Zn ribbon-like protein [Amycolatopsis cihanbeyliensis]